MSRKNAIRQNKSRVLRDILDVSNKLKSSCLYSPSSLRNMFIHIKR